MRMSEPKEYLLTLRSEPSPVPAPIRLHRLLKALARIYAFRCVSAEERSAHTERTQAHGTEKEVV